MDVRIDQTQQLQIAIESALRDVDAMRIEAAVRHEGLAVEALDLGDPKGWTDLYAAITYYADAGQFDESERVIAFGLDRCKDVEWRARPGMNLALFDLRQYAADVKKVWKRG